LTVSATENPLSLRDAGISTMHLSIGETIITTMPAMIDTVLGSCVSVTFFHAPSAMAAIFHALLPSRDSMHISKALHDTTSRFVDSAIDAILARFAKLHVRPANIEVKLFGGSFCIAPGQRGPLRAIVDVGAKNVLMARTQLARHGCRISKENVLGNQGRKLIFYTATGDVWIKPLPMTLLGKQRKALLTATEIEDLAAVASNSLSVRPAS